MKRKKGISLIVLIVTIIVIIILATVVILTITKNNPIESAKEAVFKEDIRMYQDELNMYISKEYTVSQGKRNEKITANEYIKNGENGFGDNSVYKYIPDLKEKYEEKLAIENDKLVYIGNDEKELKWIEGIINKVEDKFKFYYQEVEYIESTGTQYIDTGVKLSNNTKVDIKLQITKLNTNMTLFGSRNSPTLNSYTILFGRYISGTVYNNCFYIDMFSYQSNRLIYQYTGDTVNIKMSSSVLSANDVELTIANCNPFVTPENAYIFDTSCSPPYGKAYARLYHCKIYDNDIFVRDFVPCYRKSDGKIGLYDKVEGKFYTNQGTGEFLKENDNFLY